MKDLPRNHRLPDPDDLTAGALGQALRPRLYVTFRQAGAWAPGGHAKITFGPYLAVEVADNRMTATVSDEDGGYPSFCLAEWNGNGWEVNDGLEGGSPVYASVRFHTFG